MSKIPNNLLLLLKILKKKKSGFLTLPALLSEIHTAQTEYVQDYWFFFFFVLLVYIHQLE